MNEYDIKSQLYQKYNKEIGEMMKKSEFFNMSLSMGAKYISFIFESKNISCPPDVLKYVQQDSTGNDQESSINGNENSDDALQAAILSSKEEFNQQQRNNSIESKPVNIPEFNISMFRYLNTDQKTAQQRNISSEELFEYRKNIVKDLATFDSITGVRYKDSILQELKKINDQPKNGVIISVLLHNGDRIYKIFESEDNAASIYYWTASQDKMVKDNIRPGHFIIIKNTGEEIIPDKQINEQITEKQILLNVRLL